MPAQPTDAAPRLERIRSFHALAAFACLAAACGGDQRQPRAPRQPDLPKQPDHWVSTVVPDSGTRVRYVGRTRNFVITSLSPVDAVSTPGAVSVGDEVEGLRIGAIRCSFGWRDASYGGEQYMWRGRWNCMAGRSRQEIEAAVGDEGEKRFDYIHLSPVRLDSE